MPDSKISSAAFADTKPHYAILDGLRGVAALTVVCFHLFEAYATSHLDQRINHGYLAVDFFFVLSGFVIGYAYDDRWRSMSVGEFLRRRLIRLHPMVVMGAVIGAAVFYTQGCSAWDVTAVPVGMLLLSTLLNACMIPASTGFEIRGVGEMYPLNGPSWSLLFAFPAGLLLSRIFRPANVRGAFWIGAAAVVAVSAVPRIGGSEHLWMNGVYDTLCVAAVFPLLVYFGASGRTTDRITTGVCKFLGDISYPLYMVHYPFIYLYYAWVKNRDLTFAESLPGAAALVAGSVVLAYACLKLYDVPVRRWLAKRLLP